MYHYNSVQTHSEYKNGKNRTKTQRVVIQGKSGYKMVSIRTNGKTRKSKKPLTVQQIKCIRKCQYIPGLFKDCYDCVR